MKAFFEHFRCSYILIRIDFIPDVFGDGLPIWVLLSLDLENTRVPSNKFISMAKVDALALNPLWIED